jgi:hypothetical protein
MLGSLALHVTIVGRMCGHRDFQRLYRMESLDRSVHTAGLKGGIGLTSRQVCECQCERHAACWITLIAVCAAVGCGARQEPKPAPVAQSTGQQQSTAAELARAAATAATAAAKAATAAAAAAEAALAAIVAANTGTCQG